jgi:CRP/FNR family transcriptional regulator, cyclic AMP receptor protein
MPSPLLEKLIAISPKRVFPKNALIIQEGDVSDTIYILLKGRVRAYSIGLDAKEISFAEYRAVELFGEMSLDGQPRSASVQAMEACECSVVTRALLQSFLDQEPQFSFELILKVISRARQATDSTRNLALLDVYGRLKVFLETEPSTLKENRRELVHRYTHQDIATRVGASREMISKLLKDLENGGYLSFAEPSRISFEQIPNRW